MKKKDYPDILVLRMNAWNIFYSSSSPLSNFVERMLLPQYGHSEASHHSKQQPAADLPMLTYLLVQF